MMTSFEASCKMHHNNITADSIRKRRNLVECAFCFGKRDVDGLFNIPKVFHLIPYSARVHVCVGDISSIFVLFTIRRPRCFYVTSFYEKYPERENIDSVYLIHLSFRAPLIFVQTCAKTNGSEIQELREN